MGVVYRATELGLERSVALKVLAEQLAGDATFRRRFVAESKAAASLEHPNIVPIYAAGEHDGVLYLAMRLVPGRDLRAVLHKEGRLPPSRAAHLLAQVAAALDAAHGPRPAARSARWSARSSTTATPLLVLLTDPQLATVTGRST
jgi:serine/threonine-protein kinase